MGFRARLARIVPAREVTDDAGFEQGALAVAVEVALTTGGRALQPTMHRPGHRPTWANNCGPCERPLPSSAALPRHLDPKSQFQRKPSPTSASLNRGAEQNVFTQDQLTIILD
jgi:hypothetical protein